MDFFNGLCGLLQHIAWTSDSGILRKTIHVTFDAGIGYFENGDTTYVTKTATGKEVVSVNPIVPTGYKFAGWYDDDGLKPSNAPYDKDTVFHAKYIKLFKVTYDAGNGHFEDGQNTVTVDVEEDAYPYYKEPMSPEGMMFIGWFDIDGNSYQKTTIKEDTTFYAKYGKTEYNGWASPSNTVK